MKAKQLIALLEQLDPETVILTQTCSGSAFDSDWEALDVIKDTKIETVFCQVNEKWGYHAVTCARLYA